MLNKKKKKTSITAKIKNYMSTVTIDIFNYEKIVVKNISAYIEEVARLNKIAKNNIHVRISKNEKLTAFVYDKDNRLKEVTTIELINFFMGEGSAELFDLEQKVEQNVSDYLSDYSTARGVQTNDLTITIAKPAQEVVVAAYLNNEWIANIPLNGLIKYFTV